MSWIEYVELTYPDRDFTEFTVWDLIYPMRIIYQPHCLTETQEGCDHLPYKYIHFWKCNSTIIWQCNYCNFWCDQFDQRIMELHILKCEKVILH